MINLDEYADVVLHWIALYLLDNDTTYFDIFGFEHIPNKTKFRLKKVNKIRSYFIAISNLSKYVANFDYFD